MKTRMKIKELENRKKINEVKTWLFKEINKIFKYRILLINENKRKTLITKFYFNKGKSLLFLKPLKQKKKS